MQGPSDETINAPTACRSLSWQGRLDLLTPRTIVAGAVVLAVFMVTLCAIVVFQGRADALDRARDASRNIALIAERKPGSLAAPEGLEHAATCIEDDDLEAAGISRAELESMLAGPNRDSIKKWIEGLATETRVIFVLRAVAGFSATETAEMLAGNGGQDAKGWNADAVREIFRQGLCSLASQLIHAVK